MIGSLPRYAQAPLDYRYALDAAMTWLGVQERVAIICNARALDGEINQRLAAAASPASAALWVEPLIASWTADLNELTGRVAGGAPLVIVASLPLARIIPERRSWLDAPLGMQAGGLRHLRQALAADGWRAEDRYGIHSLRSMICNQVGQRLAAIGRPDLADRLEFYARQHYRTSPPWTSWATVCLWAARKQ